MLNRSIFLFGSSLLLTACQTAQPFNGQMGYSIKQQDNQTVVLEYTLASQSTEKMIHKRLTQACQQSLKQGNIQWDILSRHTVAATQITSPTQTIALHNERNRFGFSNTPRLQNANDYASEQVIDSKPTTYDVLQVRCQPQS